ncbi:MAG: hypothetical protein IJ660_04490 [Alphaproteobacteria bacterium]|nr:hypothetical protein [Alphaproteobacteria bacterium]
MKLTKAKIFLIVAVLCVSFSHGVRAFLLPPGPLTPTVDVVSDVTFFMDTVTVNIQNVTAQAGAYMQTINQQAKATISKYTGKFTGFMGGIFKKKEKQPLPGTKEFKESKKYDIYDKASIMEAVYELFFQYPVDCTKTDREEYKMICQAYRDLATEFYQDSIIELYASTRELEKKFDEIETSITELETAVKEGKNGMQEEQDENAVWKNAYNTYETMNSLLKIIQEIEAMRTQYIAVQAIGSGMVQPMLPEEDSDENAWNNEQATIKMATYTKQIQKLSFAQIMKNPEAALVQNQELELNASTMKNTENNKKETKPKYKRAVNFVPSQSKLETPYAANRENLASIEQINKAQALLNKAIEIHNQTKGLSTIQELYNNYDKAKKIHAKALEALKNSEQCAITYFGGMYENPHQMWNGGLSDEQIANSEKRKGISGWALKAYNVAKAIDTGVVAEADDFSELNVSTEGVDSSDLSQADRLKSQINKKSGGFKNAAKEKKVDEELKASEKLAWNIGSEAAKMLAKDQAENGINGKWGRIKKAYPVWKDTQSYYNQYIEGKYDKIIQRLNAINVLEVTLKVAEQLNNLVEDYDEKQHNADALALLQDKVLRENNNITNNVDALVAEEKEKLNALYNRKEQQLANIEREKETLVNKINRSQAQLDALNIQRQDLEEEILQAETIISGAETKIKTLLQKEKDGLGIKAIENSTETYQKELPADNEKQSYFIEQGIYRQTQQLVNAQLSQTAPKADEDSSVKTYIRSETQITETEYDEPDAIAETENVLSENREKVLALKQKLADVNQKIEETTAQLNILKTKLETEIPLSIQKVNDAYANEANAITVANDNKIQDEEKRYADTIDQVKNLDLSSYFQSHFSVPTMIDDETPYLFSLPEILNNANQLVVDTRGVAEELVKDTIDQLYAMGDSLYNPNNHRQVVDIHKQLMNKLRELPTKELTEYSSNIGAYSSYGEIMSLLRAIYQKYIVEEACLHNYCQEPDVEYFVSNEGKHRDFRAPKSVPDVPLPTIRETLYFDYGTYDNIPRSASGLVTSEGVLNNLAFVPEIWKYILRKPAYVEKEIDLSTVIRPSVERLASGGMFPCLYKNFLVTSTGDRYRLYTATARMFDTEQKEKETQIWKKLEAEGCNPCYDIEVSGKGLYYTVKNLADDVSGIAEVKSLSEFKPSQNMSELGHILTYDNGLKYNALAKDVFQRLSDVHKDSNTEIEQKDILFDIASLHQNQIGDFLKRADYEQQSRQNKAEMQFEIEKAKKPLYELFTKIGFTPAQDFDLANEDDYKLAYETLMRYRNQLISTAASQVKTFQNNNNEIIEQRIQKINDLIKVFQKDDGAYTVVSDNSKADADLEEKIKSEKTNRQVLAKQKQEADKEFKRMLHQIGNIYCSQLAGNF